MTLRAFKVGDRVRVVRVPPLVEREMPPETVELFQRCLGQILRVDGFGKYGHLELNVRDDGSQAAGHRDQTIWIEPEFVEAV